MNKFRRPSNSERDALFPKAQVTSDTCLIAALTPVLLHVRNAYIRLDYDLLAI
jgi:hypothetical protein